MTGHEKKLSRQRAIGIFQIAISGFSFGFLGVFGKLAFSHSLSVGELLSYRFLVASLMMAIGLSLFSRTRFQIRRRDLFVCAALGIFGYAVFSSFYFAAIQGVSVAMASLLLYTYPVLVAVGARFAFGEKLTRTQLVALPLALVGLFVLLSGDATAAASATSQVLSARLIAIGCGLAAALCYAGYILVSSRYQRDIDPMTSGFYVMLFATVGLFVFHRPDVSRLATFTASQVLIICGIALICTVTPLVLFLSGLQKLGNTEASLLSTVEPVTAALLGSVLLQETLSMHEWLGGAIVLCALVTTVLGAKNAKPVSPAQALD
jgi:drug/metabolite transporter (DMT)-like permease